MKLQGIVPGINEEPEENALRPFTIFTRQRNKIFAGALLTALVVISSLLLYKKKEDKPIAINNLVVPKNEVVTKNGSNTQLKLPDGTLVWLNAGSKLDYSRINETGIREVYLTGEAFFDVVKNPTRPFIIHTSTIDLKVLGTAFNVKAYPDDKTVETSLVRGSVEIRVKNRPSEKYLLKPNQKLILMNENLIEKKVKEQRINTVTVPVITIKKLTYFNGESNAIETAWIQNKLEFKDEPFADLAKRLGRWYDVTFEFMNKNLEEEPLNGAFENETLKQALDALKITTNFKYRIEDKKVIIY
jgi:ferric-dicitrate binding protein FerR (iron transport regulator)